MAFILTGFIVFGKYFILLWAGPDYEQSYWIALCFFIPLTVPLIQNLGITILQARNQMKFRSTVYVIIALASLLISIPLAKRFGGIGCAIGTSIALIAGQIIIMNIYYYRKIHIDIPSFWKEIGRMSVFPIVIGILAAFCTSLFYPNSIGKLLMAIIIFSAIYLPLFGITSMNTYERNLIGTPVRRMVQRICKR